jgi:undecaprenyl-diphosphatase
VNPSFLSRYEVDQTAPTRREALRDAGARVLAPAVVLWALIVGIGYLIVNVFNEIPVEDTWAKAVQEGRTATWDTVTMIWSRIGNTEIIIGTCVVVSLIILWRRRQWWFAIIPGIAIAVQATVFVLATVVVGRPRPEADQLDPAPPTSSYPSGHVGASTALYLTFAFMAQGIERTWLRRLLTALFLIVPLLVSYARFYRGMHHVTDIVIGLLNGVVCALLAWHWVRRRAERRADDTRADDADEARAGL